MSVAPLLVSILSRCFFFLLPPLCLGGGGQSRGLVSADVKRRAAVDFMISARRAIPRAEGVGGGGGRQTEVTPRHTVSAKGGGGGEEGEEEKKI